MTGKPRQQRRLLALPYALCSALVLTACGEDGVFGGSSGQGSNGASVIGQSRGLVRTEQDVERPDVFQVSDRGLWDGRPSLGGVWVAHPDVREPERVMIRNTANGQSTVGALFRRERENPGPALQVSSDAAEQLGILAGAPTELTVVALRREEVAVAPTEALDADDDTAIADLAAPVAIAASALEPAAGGTPASTPVSTPDEGPVAVVLPPAPAASPQTESTAASAPLPAGAMVQIGIFSVQANADGAAAALTAAGFAATVSPQEAGGRTVWRVVAGPVQDEAALSRIKGLGFVDAFVLSN